jgi:hypothetical protein
LTVRGAFTTFFYFMKLIFLFPVIIIKYYIKRRRAVSHFKKELIASGVPPWEAGELAKEYPFKFSDIMNIARGLPRS